MGARHSQITNEELQDYTALTYLSKKEVLHAFNRFKAISYSVIDKDKTARLPIEYIQRMPEFCNNPFKDRLLAVFSSAHDGRLSFEDFLDLLSILSDHAPVDAKLEYAFQVYDFDEDGTIGEDDLTQVLHRLTSAGEHSLAPGDVRKLTENILNEADLDRSGDLSLLEFQHCMLKNPDFASSFRIRL
ncbi:calcium and integrin-binding protein 1-like [Ornithodoros turicata]|uniref:calcium and integrin-binding protein 1-like n=1 Tax=Ornithodoros turicata TaxID=34597 RepID=UPI003138ED38